MQLSPPYTTRRKPCPPPCDTTEMAETKRKKTLTPRQSSKRRKGQGRKEDNRRKGPHLPNALRKEIDSLNPTATDDEEILSEDNNDVYEYEEAIPEEESKKNRRYDTVDNFEYQLPKDFEDEDIASDEGEEADGMKGSDVGNSDEEDDDDDGDDDGRHVRMLQEITGLPGDAFDGKKKKHGVRIFEAYPESEYNPSRDVLDGGGRISIDDLLAPLQGKAGFSEIRKDIQRMDRKSMSIRPPLPKPQQEKVDRKAAFEFSKKEMASWEPLVKKNREAPTIYFDENIDLGFSTIGAIASEFKPRTEFEKKMDLLVNAKEISEAHKGDGARLLELNKISVEDVKERQDCLAKMRNLLFRHELKAKRIKKIKSKTYRRLLKRDRSKGSAAEVEMDPEAARELAEKQEFKRAEERLTLKHKNTSKWAKRVIKRGFDDGTRAAISEQLQQHALLTRKRNSMHDESSSDDSMEDDDDDEVISGDDDGPSKLKLLDNAKKKTLEVLGEDDEMPKSGVLALPFMVRGQQKRKEAADEEARLALQEFDSSLKRLEDNDKLNSSNAGSFSGRKVFGAPKNQLPKSSSKVDIDNYYGETDSEDDLEDTENTNRERARTDYPQKDAKVDANVLREESEIAHDTLFKSFDDMAKDTGRTIYEVSLFASNTSKKKKNPPKDITHVERDKETNTKNSSQMTASADNDIDIEDGENESDTDSAGRMVDGILSSGNDYELPSQDDLIRRAFAGDDVEEDFEMDKQQILNEENPEPEKPVLLPGWGQWTHIQRKRGLPYWMVAEHEKARKKREEDLKKRPDAHLKHVIISEKADKKAEKFQTKTLPFPHTSAEHFEQSMRVPIGPDFNPATTVALLNRPEVVKKPGVIIKPIEYKDVNHHERSEEHKQGRQKQRNKSRGKSEKKMKR